MNHSSFPDRNDSSTLAEKPGNPDSTQFHWLDADAYLFDIDGTLLNTRDGIHRTALKRAMQEAYGIEAPLEGVIFHGKTDVGILRTALARIGIADGAFESKLAAALNVVRQHVSENQARIVTQLCPAVVEAVSILKDRGKLLGIASGNLESVGWHKVQAAGLRPFFSFGSFCDQCELRADIFRQAAREARRQLGDQTTICFVGDTPDDIEAARASEARVIAVGTGIYSAKDLSALNPDVCISSFAELLGSGD